MLVVGEAVAWNFLSEEQVEAYGRFVGPWAELEGFFFLDDADRERVARRRGDHNRVGFALQLGTVRVLGTFLVDPLEVPPEAVDYVAGQLGVADPSSVKAYAEREKTRLEHQWEIAREEGYREFAAGHDELAAWIDQRAWTTGDGPKALFDAAVAWLHQHKVLLPGAIVLARLVAQVRDAATERLYETVTGAVTASQERALRDGHQGAGDAPPPAHRQARGSAGRRGRGDARGHRGLRRADACSRRFTG